MHPLPVRTFIGTMLVVSVMSFEANLSGRWDVRMNPDFKGNPSTEHCQMKQENRKLTVTCGAKGAAMVGEVNGQKVFWKTTVGAASVAWTGELDETATKIKGTWLFTFSDGQKMRGKFTARKGPN